MSISSGLISTFTNIVLHIVQFGKVKNFAIYEQNDTECKEIFTSVDFIDASVQDDVQLMDHPIEDGTVITDHEVKNPNEVSVTVIISDDDSSSLNEINQYYKNGTELIVKAKGEMYTNMVLAAKPFKVGTDYFDKTRYELRFRSIQKAQTQYVKMRAAQVKNKKNTSKQNLGHKQAKSTSKPKISLLKSGYNAITRSGK